MTTDVEGLLREHAPRALGVVARRSGDLASADDAVQEALILAAERWPAEGVPDNPGAWLVKVALHRLTDLYRSDTARRAREERAAALEPVPADTSASHDDTLTLMLLCCHERLTPDAAIPLTLRAVGGLTTRQIAAAFLLPEATLAQRISRAKARLEGARFALPAAGRAFDERMRSVRHVLYVMFSEAHLPTAGADLTRADLALEAIRLTRMLHAFLPEDRELTGLLALMLLTDARRPARVDADGALVPLASQDRTRWDRAQIAEGLHLLTAVIGDGDMGEYRAQAAIAALHAQAPSHADTDWVSVLAVYDRLVGLAPDNPMVRLNRAAAVGMADGARAGLAALDDLDAGLPRLHAVRAHLLEEAGEIAAAHAAFAHAAERATNARERDYLTLRAAATRPRR